MSAEVQLPNSVLLVTYLFPYYLAPAILDQPIPPAQTQRFGEALLSALAQGFGGTIQVLSVAPLLDFPKSKFLVAPSARWIIADTICAKMTAYINVIGLKHLTRFISTFFYTLSWAIKNRASRRVIIMHGVQSSQIWGVLLACTLMPAITVSFITDDLGIPLKWENVFVRALRKVDVLLMRLGLRRVAGIIAMTPQLAAKLAPERPALIIPAIHNPSAISIKAPCKREPNLFTIGYFGMLYHEYGVSLLLSAFELANRENWRLVIAGRGDLEERLRKSESQDPRVKYLGFLSHNDLSKIYESINVFVNPRSTFASISTFAFPSKIVEYLGTGKPVITTNLPALDEEYRKHLIVMKNDSPEELIRCLDWVASWSDDQYNSWRGNTLSFVENTLSPSAQGKKIKSFIEQL